LVLERITPVLPVTEPLYNGTPFNERRPWESDVFIDERGAAIAEFVEVIIKENEKATNSRNVEQSGKENEKTSITQRTDAAQGISERKGCCPIHQLRNAIFHRTKSESTQGKRIRRRQG
jgi:flagellar basal body L-ring protein FlgH